MKKESKMRTVFGLFLVMTLMVFASCEFEGASVPVVDEPTVTDFTPKTGKPNTLVTLTGEGFSDYARAAKVSFGGVLATVVDSINNEQIQVRLPQTAETGMVEFNFYNHDFVFADEFVVLPGLVLGDISPSEAREGDVVTLSGERFGTDKDAVTVEFKDPKGAFIPAEILTVTDTEITMTVPVGCASGTIQVSLDPQIMEGPFFILEGLTAYPRREAEDWTDAGPDVRTEVCYDEEDESEEPMNASYIDAEDWMSFDGYLMDDAKSIDLRVSSRDDGEYEIRLDNATGELLGTVTWESTGGWQNWITASTTLKPATGVHTLFILVKSPRSNLNWFKLNNEEDLGGASVLPQQEAEDWVEIGPNEDSIQTEDCTDEEDTSETPTNASYVDAEDWFNYGEYNLSGAATIDMRVSSREDGVYEVHIDAPDGDLIGTVEWPSTGGWQNWITASGDLTPTDGKHQLYIVVKSAKSNFNWFKIWNSNGQ